MTIDPTPRTAALRRPTRHRETAFDSMSPVCRLSVGRLAGSDNRPEERARLRACDDTTNPHAIAFDRRARLTRPDSSGRTGARVHPSTNREARATSARPSESITVPSRVENPGPVAVFLVAQAGGG